LEGSVVAIVGESAKVAAHWAGEVAMLFIDGGHGEVQAAEDYQAWSPKLTLGGVLAIHDVFEYPNEGGQAPRDHIYRPALDSGDFEQLEAVGSLRVLRRI
ncbi:MAG: class I SAM-dependent methyltransferase, partial [Acidimicrobiales bacterium]